MAITALPAPTLIGGEKLTHLDEQTAKLLDAKIKEAVSKLADDTYEVLRLLKNAKQGQIHEALGFDSWTAYICEVLQVVPADREQRQVLVAVMSGEGMSQRAIASVLGVDQKTVSNDLRSGEENSSTKTTGLDGKRYERKPWAECVRAKLDKLVQEANSAERCDELAVLLQLALKDLGINVVEV